jgi:hypothetical protein
MFQFIVLHTKVIHTCLPVGLRHLTVYSAALSRGSALDTRVQLRASFVLGGVLVLIVCC